MELESPKSSISLGEKDNSEGNDFSFNTTLNGYGYTKLKRWFFLHVLDSESLQILYKYSRITENQIIIMVITKCVVL